MDDKLLKTEFVSYSCPPLTISVESAESCVEAATLIILC
ncbi:hypothetical protein SALWKB12_2057 [Snodgrassella communis]|nr:hypothetical protein SALWKB12_2057 [Snodgrassella communis]